MYCTVEGRCTHSSVPADHQREGLVEPAVAAVAAQHRVAELLQRFRSTLQPNKPRDVTPIKHKQVRVVSALLRADVMLSYKPGRTRGRRLRAQQQRRSETSQKLLSQDCTRSREQ